MKKTLMNNITKTHERCKEEGIGISLSHLRYIVKSGKIPTCRVGNKYLINWNLLMAYLNTGDTCEPEPNLPSTEPAKNPVSVSTDNLSIHRIRTIR